MAASTAAFDGLPSGAVSARSISSVALANVVTTFAHLPAVVKMGHWAMHTDVAILALLFADGDLGRVPRVVESCASKWTYR